MVTSAFFMGTNLVNQMPDTPGMCRELARLDVRVCVDQFLTDTAECCDVFLPSTTMLEEAERAINSQVPEDRRRPGRVTARVHPDAASARGLGDGEAARLVSPRGTLAVTLECGDDVRPDSVFVAKGDWARYERGLNVLTEPRYTAGTGTAFNQNYVRLEPA